MNTIPYELALELKNAGFPGSEHWIDMYGEGKYMVRSVSLSGAGEPYEDAPTLSELIEACGEEFDCLMKQDGFWVVNHTNDAHGPTPEIAVARLYLATLESSKSEEKCKYCISLHDPEIVCKEYIQSLVAPTPPSEEKKCCEKCLQYGGNGTAQAVAVAYCSKPDCPCHSPTQEEKKLDYMMSPGNMKQVEAEYKCKCNGPIRCFEHLIFPASPTPPDAWEKLTSYINEQLQESHNEGTYKYDWLYEDILKKIEELRKV